MKSRISVLTLGVDDVERSMKFYRDGLGLSTKGITGQQYEHGTVAFFDLESGFKLALFSRADLALDAGMQRTGRSPADFSIGHLVRTREEVDAVMRQAAACGAVIVKQAAATFWGGYAGYFQDLDGHLWEVVWNPRLLPET